uniref:Serine/threonine specific protein phosphatases domain-containing protein n=1 Tax=Ditylenchus dipsaci TaxID=166011 RepID=A0A915CMB1_9BILA
MHGGISPEIQSWDTLTSLGKPRSTADCDKGIASDLMWADPSRKSCTNSTDDFQANSDRGTSYLFSDEAVKAFNEKLDLDLVVRAHEMVRRGHQFNADNQMCTIFSAPNYCGVDGNSASVMLVSKQLEVSFVTLKPRIDEEKLQNMSMEEKSRASAET